MNSRAPLSARPGGLDARRAFNGVADPQGLADATAAERLRADGPNLLPSSKPKSNLRIAAEVLREPMFLLLAATGLVYLFLGGIEEAVALLVAIAVVIGTTVYQQGKTERSLEKLRDLSSPRALVVREGRRQRIAGREVVRGDLLVLGEGDRVAADGILLSSVNLAIDESLLTGESAPAEKQASDDAAKAGIYSGSLVVQGSGLAEVTATGVHTEIGKLGLSLQRIEVEPTSIERETRSMIRVFAAVSAGLCAVVAVAYGLTSHDWLHGALAGLALAISMTPEEFPVVLTVFLALGAWRISKKRVLTRRVAAIEMLGAATVLCVDKTGTLTMNRMSVGETWAGAGGTVAGVLKAAAFASAGHPVDPMERAIHEAFRSAEGSRDATVEQPALVREYPLSKQLLAMSRVVERGSADGYDVFAKGAPEAIAQMCALPQRQRTEALATAEGMAVRGMRVLGVAASRFTGSILPESQQEFAFEFLGVIGLEDPLRPSANAAIRECGTAGIRVIMITGDYPATAHSIAEQAGLARPRESVTGAQIEAMTPEDLRGAVRRINVFARVAPDQKLRLVEALKADGEIVAMTGDGVNDAPALKSAHIGIAMGGRGTDVAREAAALVLLDDDFSSIVDAIRLGRRIYDNLRKAMTYVLAIHVPIAGMSLLPVLFGLPMVLMPLHIVFLELIIDPACSVAFESEPENPAIMRRRPRDPKARLFDARTIGFAFSQGGWLLLATLGAYLTSLYRGQGPMDARAMGFLTLVVGNLALIWANRSRTRTIPQILRSPNLPLWAVTAGALTLLATVLYVRWIRSLFQFSALQLADVAVSLVFGLGSVTWFEMNKWKEARKSDDRTAAP